MNVRITLFFLCSLLLSFGAKASDIPGGAVFVEDKNIVYHDFETQEKINLTKGLNKEFNDNFTVSGDGMSLFWAEDFRIWLKKLPDEQPSPIRALVPKSLSGREMALSDVIIAGAKNLASSQTGQSLSFEFEKTSGSLIPVPAGSPLDIGWKAKWDDTGNRYPYPLLLIQPDVCNATVYFKIDRSSFRVGNAIFGQKCQTCPLELTYDYCGNTAGYSPVYPYRKIWQYYETASPNQIPVVPSANAVGPGMNNLVYTPEQAIPRFSIKRNAYFGCWSKNFEAKDQMLALIYQTPNGWGPIEIRARGEFGDLMTQAAKAGGNIKLSAKDRGLKPGLYEIIVRLASCDGLAWKPNGSLACFSDGKVYVIKKEDIEKGIEESGIEKYPDRSYNFVPQNNVFAVKPEVIASNDTQGSEYCWISDQGFVFRDRTGNLCLWQNGRKDILIYSVPKEFSYCGRPPFDNQKEEPLTAQEETDAPKYPETPAEKQPVSETEAISGTNVSKKYGRDSFPIIKIGDISTIWFGINQVTFQLNGMRLNGQKNLEYALIEAEDLVEITDPSQYKFRRNPISEAGSRVSVSFGEKQQILILKLYRKYAAIKPIKIESEKRPQAEEEISEEMRKAAEKRKKETGVNTIFQEILWTSLTYEWKYWAEEPSKQRIRTALLNK